MENVNFSVDKGEVVAATGHSASNIFTSFHVMERILKPVDMAIGVDGLVVVNGRDIVLMNKKKMPCIVKH